MSRARSGPRGRRTRRHGRTHARTHGDPHADGPAAPAPGRGAESRAGEGSRRADGKLPKRRRTGNGCGRPPRPPRRTRPRYVTSCQRPVLALRLLPSVAPGRRKVDPHARLHDRTRTASSPTPAVPAPCPGVHAPAARAPLLRAGENALAGQVRRSLLSGPRPTPNHSRTTRARCAPRGIPRAPGRSAGKRRCGPGFRSEAHPEAQENPAPPGKGEWGQVTHRHKAAP